MSSSAEESDWRERRRRSARTAIVEAAWGLVRDVGLAGLSMRDLAARAGITTPTVYAYFGSKNDIYDAMFGEAAAEFAQYMAAAHEAADPTEVLVAGTRRFFEFCTEDVPRYQLLFQRTIPGFEPSAESYAHAVRALEGVRHRLAAIGVTDPRHVDLWTAVTTGLVDQQVSNDPGGTRWTGLLEEAAAMFLSHCQTRDCLPRAPGGASRDGTPRKGRRR